VGKKGENHTFSITTPPLCFFPAVPQSTLPPTDTSEVQPSLWSCESPGKGHSGEQSPGALSQSLQPVFPLSFSQRSSSGLFQSRACKFSQQEHLLEPLQPSKALGLKQSHKGTVSPPSYCPAGSWGRKGTNHMPSQHRGTQQLQWAHAGGGCPKFSSTSWVSCPLQMVRHQGVLETAGLSTRACG